MLTLYTTPVVYLYLPVPLWWSASGTAGASRAWGGADRVYRNAVVAVLVALLCAALRRRAGLPETHRPRFRPL